MPEKIYVPLVTGDMKTAEDQKPKPKKTRTPKPTSTPKTTPAPTPTFTPTPTPEEVPPVPPGTSQKIAIDPITRIEGHLRIEVEIKDGYVTDAWSAGMMFRGIELVMPGRDPCDAWVFTQRICGV